MTSLDEIKRQAELLETGRRGDNRIVIKIKQIGSFFNRIATGQNPTPNGREILAFQGVDPTKADKLLKKIKKASKVENIAKQEANYETVNVSTINQILKRERFLNVYYEWDIQRKSTLQTLNKINSPIIEQGKFVSNAELNETAVGLLSANVFSAKEIARKVDNLSAPDKTATPDNTTTSPDKINKLSNFLSQLHSNHSIFYSYFTLLSNLAEPIEFLQKQYRIHNFAKPDDITVDDVKEKAIEKLEKQYGPNNFDEIEIRWREIWICFRAGLKNLYSEYNDKCQKDINNTKTTEMQRRYYQIISILELLSEQNEIIDNIDHPVAKTIDEILNNEFPTQEGCLLETIEDTLYTQLYACRSTNTTFNKVMFAEVKQFIYEETAQMVKKNPSLAFIRPLFLILTEQYDAAAKLLIECNQHPIETAHICLILYSRLTSSVKFLVADFIENYICVFDDEPEFGLLYLSFMVDSKDKSLTHTNEANRAIKYLLAHPNIKLTNESLKEVKKYILRYINKNYEFYDLADIMHIFAIFDESSPAIIERIRGNIENFSFDQLCAMIVTLSRPDTLNYFDQLTDAKAKGFPLFVARNIITNANALNTEGKYQLLQYSKEIFTKFGLENDTALKLLELYLAIEETVDITKLNQNFIINLESILDRFVDIDEQNFINRISRDVVNQGTFVGETIVNTIIFLQSINLQDIFNEDEVEIHQQKFHDLIEKFFVITSYINMPIEMLEKITDIRMNWNVDF